MRKLGMGRGHTGYREFIQENPAFWQVTRLKDAKVMLLGVVSQIICVRKLPLCTFRLKVLFDCIFSLV
jgi:hypothetical protein